mmetsp:Transcript_112566/g.268296  ORF Transcript_112566/g.268296 Transcript_112566/m.268296 type:complete len:203 (-) Transcript_112566:2-610(-)
MRPSVSEAWPLCQSTAWLREIWQLPVSTPTVEACASSNGFPISDRTVDVLPARPWPRSTKRPRRHGKLSSAAKASSKADLALELPSGSSRFSLPCAPNRSSMISTLPSLLSLPTSSWPFSLDSNSIFASFSAPNRDRIAPDSEAAAEAEAAEAERLDGSLAFFASSSSKFLKPPNRVAAGAGSLLTFLNLVFFPDIWADWLL